MSHDLYYFTGTGNSLAVARLLTAATGARLLPVSAAKSAESVTGSTVGVVFPVYMYNPPRAVVEFLKKLRSCDYLYIVMTMGGGSGKTAHKVSSTVAAHGIRLGASFSLLMPDNYIVWNEAADEARQQRLFAAAQGRIDEIAAIVKAGRLHTDNERALREHPDAGKVPFPFSIIPDGVLQPLYDLGYAQIPKMDRAFCANDHCNGCGICAKLCPTGNITMHEKKPTWQHRCEQCFACLQWCPNQAIDYGKKTAGKKRYTHPEVTIKDMTG
jgi:ferredoxin/flavodoxin